MQKQSFFDVIVVGGGHAGCEAAHAAARMGCSTAMISFNPDRIGFMSCNPAMGGLAKGQLIKEIDALGGIMGRITDQTAIQYRRLNSSKGPAVRSSRAQCDKRLYALQMQAYLCQVPRLSILEGEVVDLCVEAGKVSGVQLKDGSVLRARSVVVTSGTFLQAIMFTGFEKTQGGRAGDQSAFGLSQSLSQLGFSLKRLKTGTPPRLHRKSIDYSRLEPQPGDLKPLPFSFYQKLSPFPYLPQISCFITYTTEQTHEMIEANFHRSPLFMGLIQGLGPRYCPSIEDKVKRFRDKSRHQLFLEPEGLETDEIYVNGISTSLPQEVQVQFVHSIPGLEKAEFIRYGYAVEYDCVDARQLKVTFESKDVSGLFFAGQVNGTSGYEEAGAQGLIAGINAALRVQEKDPFILSRLEAYIGVLADDLVLKGADEPYRMFTSRAEYRLLLREDNADLRLSERGWKLGLLSDVDFSLFDAKRSHIEEAHQALKKFFLYPTPQTNEYLTQKGLSLLKDRASGEVFLRRPEVSWNSLLDLGAPLDCFSEEAKEQIEIRVKYEGYIQRDLELLEGMRKNEHFKIPSTFDFNAVSGLSHEVKLRLKQTRPETLGQISRMQGLTPAAVAQILIHLKMLEAKKA